MGDSATQDVNDNDLFISYTHIDNVPLDMNEPGWISRLHYSLGVRLQQIIGGQVSIWRDEKLTGNDNFSDSILKGLKNVPLLVCVVSPRYVNSDWCIKEFEQFTHDVEAQGGLQMGEKSRIFKVIKTPLELEEQPDVLQTQLGYCFYDVNPANNRPDEFRQDPGANKDPRYWAKLEDLAYDIAQTYKLYKQSRTEPANSANKKVYIPQPTLDIDEEYQSIKREFNERGYDVVPQSAPARKLGDFIAETKAELSECELIVNMIGGHYGSIHEGTEKSDIHWQTELTAEHAKAKGIHRIIWLPKAQSVTEECQIEFIDNLRNEEYQLDKTEFLETDIEELKNCISNAVNKKPTTAHSPVATSASAEDNIYLLYEETDYDYTEALEEALLDSGHNIIHPLFTGSEQLIHDDYMNNLKSAQSVIIVQANSRAEWLSDKVRDITQIEKERQQPFQLRGVYLTGDETVDKLRFRARKFATIRHLPESNGDFDEFLQPLSVTGGH